MRSRFSNLLFLIIDSRCLIALAGPAAISRTSIESMFLVTNHSHEFSEFRMKMVNLENHVSKVVASLL